jgi:hypothetical protein
MKNKDLIQVRSEFSLPTSKFAENLRTSPLNKDLSNESNETTFSLIHLTEQYL